MPDVGKIVMILGLTKLFFVLRDFINKAQDFINFDLALDNESFFHVFQSSVGLI